MRYAVRTIISAHVFVALAALLGVTHWAAAGTLRAVPDTITFSQMNASATITLMNGDAPLDVSAIKSIKALASDHDYMEMFKIVRPKSGPATITVKTNSDFIEVGTYDLTFATTAGTAIVNVKAPLDAHKDIVEKRMAETGKSELEVKMELGLVTKGPREETTIILPEKLAIGQVIDIKIPSTAGHVYVWTVDGKEVTEGPYAEGFKYTFDTAGDHLIGYKVYANKALVGEWTGGVSVLKDPALAVSVTTK
jgi:hypothetical protein